VRISELFSAGSPVFSFEFFQPKGPEDQAAFESTVLRLKKLEPGFVTVTYGASGHDREKTFDTAGWIRGKARLETAAHLTCLSHTRGEIAALLDRIRSLGIESVVALRGDPPRGAPLPSNAPREMPHARDLVSFIRSRREGFAVAVAGYPEGHPEAPSREEDLRRLKEKVDAGADWIITQLFFDNSAFFDFVSRARAAGIACPIVPGIMPVTSFAQVRRFAQMCGASLPQGLSAELSAVSGDPEAVVRWGIETALRQCRELLARGVPGIHFYTLNKSRSTETILGELKGA
jgi:methylenetetrahydrofolate reductase (NADPH)